MMPSSTPYWPPDRTTIERRPSAPSTQSRTWSIAALAADAADDAPRASMISAPRLPTRGMYSFSYQSMSTFSTARSPFTFALNRSGNIVGEWLPHTTRSWMSATLTSSFWASCATARFSSSRVMAVNRSLGMSGALLIAMSAFVFAGLPTTRIFTSSAAWALSASPCGLKIAPLASRRSARSMPFVRGRAPTRRATFTPSNALSRSSVTSTERSSGKAQSKSSSAVPSAAFTASGISSRRRSICSSGPRIWPEAMRKRRAEPLLPAAPVTVTVVGIRGSPMSSVASSRARGSVRAHRALQPLVERVEELLGGEEVLVAADEQREVLRHLPVLDRLDAHPLERLGELADVGSVVHAAAVGEAARPREDRGDRVRGGRLALLVLAEVARDGSVRGLGLDRLAVGGHQHARHEAERPVPLGDRVGLHV